jgi:hypothetical protein
MQHIHSLDTVDGSQNDLSLTFVASAGSFHDFVT